MLIELVIEANKNGTAKLIVNERIVATWYIADYEQQDNFIDLYDLNKVLIGDVCTDVVKVIIN